MKTSLGARIVLGFGFLCWLAVLTLAILYVAEAPRDPGRLGAWFVIVLFGGLTLRVMPVMLRTFGRDRGLVTIDDEFGVTNLKDNIGPVAWDEIHGASVQSLGSVRYLGSHLVLFVEVEPAVAERHLRRASWLVRWGPRRRSANGLVELAIMGYPPFTGEELAAALEKIQSRSQLAANRGK